MLIPLFLFTFVVEIDHLYGSKWVNDELYKSKVRQLKQACVENQSIDENIERLFSELEFILSIVDKVNHDIVTVDG